MADIPILRIEVRNSNPVELSDLAASFSALASSYEDFAAAHADGPFERNARLYVRAIRSGSIIADLQAALDQASFIFDHLDVLAGFVTNIDDIIRFFLMRDSDRLEHGEHQVPSRVEAERISQILEPVAKDGGSQLIVQITGDVHIHPVVCDSQTANVVQNRVRRFLGPKLPISQNFRREPLTLFQMRGVPGGSVGDRGIIEKYTSKPVRLQFLNETSKKQILAQSKNPFRMVFIVDGEVGLVDSKPAIYKIRKVHEAFDLSDI